MFRICYRMAKRGQAIRRLFDLRRDNLVSISPRARSKIAQRSGSPVPLSKNVRAVMLANVGGQSSLEKRFRSALFKLGLRYRAHYRVLADNRRSVDIAFLSAKVCVFIDGCFWHGCTAHRSLPRHNAGWWQRKIHATRQRDKASTAQLEKHGWAVIRLWEHELIADFALCVAQVEKFVRERQPISKLTPVRRPSPSLGLPRRRATRCRARRRCEPSDGSASSPGGRRCNQAGDRWQSRPR